MKYIIFPLAIMFLLCIFSMLGLGSAGTMGTLNIGNNHTTQSTYYYTQDGFIVCYQNGTAYHAGDNGQLRIISPGRFDHIIVWSNSSGTYNLWLDDSGTTQASSDGVNTPTPWSAALSQSLGFIVLVLGLMAVSVIAGFHFFGTGVSEIGASAIYKTSAYLAIWGVMSVLSITLLTALPMYTGMIFFLALTLIYTLGIINSVGHPSDD